MFFETQCSICYYYCLLVAIYATKYMMMMMMMMTVIDYTFCVDMPCDRKMRDAFQPSGLTRVRL